MRWIRMILFLAPIATREVAVGLLLIATSLQLYDRLARYLAPRELS